MTEKQEKDIKIFLKIIGYPIIFILTIFVPKIIFGISWGNLIYLNFSSDDLLTRIQNVNESSSRLNLTETNASKWSSAVLLVSIMICVALYITWYCITFAYEKIQKTKEKDDTNNKEEKEKQEEEND